MSHQCLEFTTIFELQSQATRLMEIESLMPKHNGSCSLLTAHFQES
ncbi:hypothetical protein ACHAXN_008441 [Cyclotella atomus]